MVTPDLFDCERRNLRLTAPGCSRLWLAAQIKEPQPWEGNAACRTCPIGASNSGREIAPHAESAEEIQHICARCFRVSSRLIRRLYCPSCYNRELEVVRGYNGKGTPPKRLLARVFPVALVVVGDKGGRQRNLERVTSRAEAMMTLAKTAKGWLAFAPPPYVPQPPGWQMEMRL